MWGREPDGQGRVHATLWSRFRGNRLARVSAWLLGFLLLTSIVTLPYALKWHNVQALSLAVRHAPSATPVVPYSRYASSAMIDGTASQASGRDGGIVTRLAPIAHRLVSAMGHDDLGRSLFYRVWPALLVSLAIGLAAAVIAVVVGTGWGAIAAFAGGRVDMIMMRIVDVLYGLPYILMVILLKTALTRPLTALLGGHTRYADIVILFVAIGGVSWLTMARVVRGQVLSLRAEPFVEAARALGAGPIHILRRHILPNLVGPIVVCATLVVPQAVLQEAFLSFLGIGVPQPSPSLGRLAADGVEAVNMFVSYWWLLVFPCGVLVLTLVALNFIGDGLRDALDPKSATVPLV